MDELGLRPGWNLETREHYPEMPFLYGEGDEALQSVRPDAVHVDERGRLTIVEIEGGGARTNYFGMKDIVGRSCYPHRPWFRLRRTTRSPTTTTATWSLRCTPNRSCSVRSMGYWSSGTSVAISGDVTRQEKRGASLPGRVALSTARPLRAPSKMRDADPTALRIRGRLLLLARIAQLRDVCAGVLLPGLPTTVAT